MQRLRASQRSTQRFSPLRCGSQNILSDIAAARQCFDSAVSPIHLPPHELDSTHLRRSKHLPRASVYLRHAHHGVSRSRQSCGGPLPCGHRVQLPIASIRRHLGIELLRSRTRQHPAQQCGHTAHPMGAHLLRQQHWKSRTPYRPQRRQDRRNSPPRPTLRQPADVREKMARPTRPRRPALPATPAGKPSRAGRRRTLANADAASLVGDGKE